jgi:hypothetical protein
VGQMYRFSKQSSLGSVTTIALSKLIVRLGTM